MSSLIEQEITIEELQQQVMELQKKRTEISQELHKFQEELQTQTAEAQLKNHEILIGKSFLVTNKNYEERLKISSLKAFKILEVLEAPNQNYAICLSIHYKKKINCLDWDALSIAREVLGVWASVSRNPEKTNRLIDYCKELPEEDWNTLLNGAYQHILEEH